MKTMQNNKNIKSHLLSPKKFKVPADIEINLVSSKNKEETLVIAIDY